MMKPGYEFDTDQFVISSTGSVHLVKGDIPDTHKDNVEDDDENKNSVNDMLLDKPSNVKTESNEDNHNPKQKKKNKLFSFSVLKDVRFMTLCVATFIFALPSTGLFLPALCKSRGLTDIEAAYLLSIIAGCDTVTRVASGIVMDLKQIRTFRPLIYNVVSFAQCVALFIFPSLRTFGEFVAVCCIHGAVMGKMCALSIFPVNSLSKSVSFLCST